MRSFKQRFAVVAVPLGYRYGVVALGRAIVCNDYPASNGTKRQSGARQKAPRLRLGRAPASSVMIYIRWCCIELLNPPNLPASGRWVATSDRRTSGPE